MTDRIDHVGWARAFVSNAEDAFDPNETGSRDSATVAENLAFAQVHATLALVEQQRIANVIAVGAHWQDTGHPALDAMIPVLRDDIAAALGLDS